MSVSTSDALTVCVPETDDETKLNPDTEESSRSPEMKSMHVVSNIRNRYARTVVTSKYFNEDLLHAQEATFSIVLPDTAFIAGFVMEIKGKKYEAYVKEKEEAKQEYDLAVSSGRAAAHVAVSARDSNMFTVSANVEPHSDVTFILTYEELLVRKHSKYDIVINLHPTQFIDDLQVDVHINETRPVRNVETPALRSGNEITTEVTRNKYATISKDEDNIVHVNFKPTIDQQKEMVKAMEAAEKKDNNTEELTGKGKFNSISGQFIVQYDVERDPLGGEVLVNDGYFVHFFAPTDLKPIPKHVIFVLDVSGSMGGTKLEQLKDAMSVILDELNPEDYFNLVKFSDDINVLNSNFKWEKVNIPAESKLPNSFAVKDKNITSVKAVLKQMTDEGCTNIYDALIVGLRMTSKGILHLPDNDKQHKPQPIIVFLTDGQPNITESNPDKIIKMVGNRNHCDKKAAIFALAFGADADAKFLKELAIQNSGFSRHIYEAADAALQLQDFYKEISSPLLTNVKFNYVEGLKIEDLTQHNFDIFFNGTEFVVTGKIDEMVDDFVFVEASSFNASVEKFCPVITAKTNNTEEYGNLERLWAYLTIKQLLDKKFEKKESKETNEPCDMDKIKEDIESAEKKALTLALKYAFVTPVTSLIVVKPDEPEAEQNVENTDIVSIQNDWMSSPIDFDMQHISHNMMYASASHFMARNVCLKKCVKKSVGKAKLSQEVKEKASNIFTQVKRFFSKKPVYDNANIITRDNIQIDCDVENRFASIREKRIYQNSSANPKEITYNIILPEGAVVTGFYLNAAVQKYKPGQCFKGIGMYEEEALNEYQTAIFNKLDAGLVNLQDSNKVTVTVHIQPGEEISFELHYQKLLEIKNNKYDLNINLHNEKFNENVTVTITLYEEENTVIKNILPHFKYHNEIIENKHVNVTQHLENMAVIEFNTELQEIAKALKTTDDEFSCQFNVEYETEPNISNIQVSHTDEAPAVAFPYLVAVKGKNSN